MRIELQKVAKRYKQEWIFRKLDYVIDPGQRLGITGHNGSGKSTLLRILSGHLSPSKGKILFQDNNGQLIPSDQVYKHVFIAAPYIALIEELSLLEAIHFHQKFKPFIKELNTATFLDTLNLSKAKNKEIRHFSSGMKQRFKLLLAFATDSQLLLLDEPTTNLDQQGVEWYHFLIDKFLKDRTFIVASNATVDFHTCSTKLAITDFKS